VKAAVWHHPYYGPAFAATLPLKENEWPDTASIPYKIPPGVLGQLLSKGSQPTWPQYGAHLEEKLPLDGHWTVEDVPDGYSAHAALYHVREKAAAKGLDSSQA
jgi:hypothetical protein